MNLSTTHHKHLLLAALLALAFCPIRSPGFDYIYGTQYVSNTVVRFDSSGHGSIFASGLNAPTGLALDSSGNLFVANSGNNTIVRIDPAGHQSMFASSGLNSPFGLAFDKNGFLYAANSLGGTITRYDSSGHLSTFASGLLEPWSMAFDSHGNLFVADYVTDADYITKIDPAGHSSVFATTSAGLSGPYGLVFDGSDNLYVSNFHSNDIVKLDPAGNSSLVQSGLLLPSGLTMDQQTGDLYVADFPYQLEKISSTGQRTFFADTSHFGSMAQLVIAPIPEPGALSLIIAAACLAGRRFRQVRAADQQASSVAC